MHYYKFFIGDYRAATAHLSPVEHYIYRSLIDQMYLDERPIPLETKSVLRRLRLTTESEANSLQLVLDEFFEQTTDGWVQRRVMSEIDEYHGNNEVRRENGKKGGRPKKTESVSVWFEAGTKVEPDHNLNHKPLTTNQEPETKNQEPQQTNSKVKNNATRQVALACPDDVDRQVWDDFLTHRKARRAPLTETALKTIRSQAQSAGVPLQAALEACCQRGWTGFKADWMKDTQAAGRPVSNQQALEERNLEAVRRAKERIFGKADRTIEGEAL